MATGTVLSWHSCFRSSLRSANPLRAQRAVSTSSFATWQYMIGGQKGTSNLKPDVRRKYKFTSSSSCCTSDFCVKLPAVELRLARTSASSTTSFLRSASSASRACHLEIRCWSSLSLSSNTLVALASSASRSIRLAFNSASWRATSCFSASYSVSFS